MPTAIADSVLDATLNELRNRCDKLVVTEGQATTYADANDTKGVNTGKKLFEAAMVPADFTVAAAGSGTGRQVQSAQKDGLTGLAAGTGDHFSLLETGTTTILATFPFTPTLAVSLAQTYSVPIQTLFNRGLTSV